MFGTKQSMDYGKMTPPLEWRQMSSQQQSVLFLGQPYQQTTEKLFRDKVCYVWDTLSTDYGKMIPRQSALCFGQHYQWTMEKILSNKVRYVWYNTINGLQKNDFATKCAMFGTRQSIDYEKIIRLLVWRQMSAQRQGVLCLRQDYQMDYRKMIPRCLIFTI